ncbi:MAG: glycosyltransferase family 4 protein [Candidatus Sulfotelmatobacter sp.]
MGQTRTSFADCWVLTRLPFTSPKMLTVFTPSFADEADTNAQNLTVKEVAARLSPEQFRLVMLYENSPDPRIASRPNTRLLRWHQRGNTLRILMDCLRSVPDVYFFPRVGPLDAAFFILRKCLRLKTAVVSYIVSGGLYNPDPVPAKLARNVREADVVFCNTKYLCELVRERLGCGAGIRYDGIDRRFYFPPRQPRSAQVESSSNRLTVLFAGSLRPYKRTPLVIQQAARWPNVDFRIAGRGEEEQKCRDLASQSGCSNVTFLGHLSAQELGEEMRRADIFFFPSILEGHPQVLLQAAASGLPAIALNIYRPEYVVHEKTGFLAATDDELQPALDLLLRDRSLRHAMSEEAVRHAQQFDWDRITRQWEEAFLEAADRRRAR